jgi:hypothetical protein
MGGCSGWLVGYVVLACCLFCFVLVLEKAEQIDMPRWEGGPGMYLSIW